MTPFAEVETVLGEVGGIRSAILEGRGCDHRISVCEEVEVLLSHIYLFLRVMCSSGAGCTNGLQHLEEPWSF